MKYCQMIQYKQYRHFARSSLGFHWKYYKKLRTQVCMGMFGESMLTVSTCGASFIVFPLKASI